MPTKLSLDNIRTDGGTQPRAKINQGIVSEYADAMNRGEEFPPIQVMHDGESYWLYDGFHRLEAARKNGRNQIEAEIHQGTKEDAQWASLAANKRHGLRRSQADKRRAIKRALKRWGEDKSNNQIAQHIGCSHPTVAKYRRELESTCKINKSNERQGADGRTIDTSNIGGSSGSSSTSDTEPYDPETRGDGAPPNSNDADPGERVTADEAVERVCQRLKGIRTSSVFGELKELRRLRDELDALHPEHEDEVAGELQKTAQRLLEWASEFSSTDNEPTLNHE